MPNYGPQSAPYRWIRTPLPSTRFLEPYPRIELNSTELQLLQPCSQSTSWRWRAWPITRRVTGSTWCRSAQFSLFRLLWTPHWKAWARLKEIGTRWNQRCLIFQCVPIYLKGRSFTSVFIFSWGTPLKRQSVLLHTHTHTHQTGCSTKLSVLMHAYRRNCTCNRHQIFRACCLWLRLNLLWRRCDRLCTSGSVVDVMFAYQIGQAEAMQ